MKKVKINGAITGIEYPIFKQEKERFFYKFVKLLKLRIFHADSKNI